MISEADCKQRKAEVLAILTEGLPPIPSHLRRLAALLTATPVDLKQVASVIRGDRYLTSRLLRSNDPSHADQRNGVKRVEEAAILMGTEKLKNLIFTNYLILLMGDRLRRTDMDRFWTHSLATAALSELAARAVGYDDVEKAYLGGIMHDSGKLPLLIVAAAESNAFHDWGGCDESDSLQMEREHFGLDHCQLGRGLGFTWNFDPALIEVLEWHHEPQKARFDPDLVGIVAAADHFHNMAGASANPALFAIDDFYRSCFGRLNDDELDNLVSLFGREYARVRRQAESWLQESDFIYPADNQGTDK